MLFKLVLMACLGQLFLINGSDSESTGAEDQPFRPKYGELRTSDLLRQQAISGVTHQEDAVWLKNEGGYRAAIEHALDQSKISLSDLRPADCEVDEKANIVSSGGQSAAFLVHQYLRTFYPFDPELFDERVTVHDLDLFNRQLAGNRAYLLSQLPSKMLPATSPRKDHAQMILDCGHKLCRGCAWAIQALNKEHSSCPTCRAPMTNVNLVKKLSVDEECPVCMDSYQTTKRYGKALGAELRFSPIQKPYSEVD